LSDGLIAGVARLDELVRAVRETGFCEKAAGDLAYSFILSFLRESADVLADRESDPTRD
jgi:hypothetical protein